MTPTDEETCNIRERLARIEEKQVSSDKALVLAEKVIDSKSKYWMEVIAIVLSVIAIVSQYLKK